MKKYHYVYLITNLCPIDQRKYYIGVRTSKTHPQFDNQYHGSSKYLQQALSSIGHQNFCKEILSIWDTRKQANAEEIRLHQLHDVAKNPQYYNKAKATSTGFCTIGMVTVINKITGFKEFVNVQQANDCTKYKKMFENVVCCVDKNTGEKLKVTKQEYKNNPNLEHTVTGTITVINTQTGLRQQVTQQEFKTNPNLVSQHKGFVNVVDTTTGKRKSVTQQEYQQNQNYVFVTSGKITVVDIRDGSTKMVSVQEYHNSPHYKSQQTKHIGVYDDNHNLVYQSFDNFKEFCVCRKMPYNAFAQSLQQNGKPIYSNTGSNTTRLEKMGYLKFKGWYAKQIVELHK